MIAKLIEFSIKNRALVLILTVVLVASGVWSIFNLRLDAIPDLSDVQVIVTTEVPGQNPQVVDDQVTYPLSRALLSVPGATVVRGLSMFEQSFVYVLFEDGTDIYWARSRVLEYLNFARDRLPKGVEPKLGPDATGVGWVFQYVLYPGYYSEEHPQGFWHDEESGKWYADPLDAPADERAQLKHIRAFEKDGTDPISGSPLKPTNQDLAQLRTIQDWYLRYPLQSVEDVSEVASIGGFVKQYQVVLDPIKLRAFQIPLADIIEAITRSNNDVGGSVIEKSENEYMVRSRAYLKGLTDLAAVPIGAGKDGTPILLGDVEQLQIGGESRRGIGELDGIGEAVGGVIVARFGANAFKVIQDVKARLVELESGLPSGVFIKPTYDRSLLISRAVHTLRDTLIEEILVVGIVCILFLLHLRSELVAVFVVPSSVVIALFILHWLGMNANIMSLGGIAISIGVVVDSAIIMVENAHKHLDREEERLHEGGTPTPRSELILQAATEVGPQLFFSLLIITVSFLPVFVLGGEAGRLFKPLAFTKTFSMAAASLLSVTIIPVLMYFLITSRVLPSNWSARKTFWVIFGAALIPGICLFLFGGLSKSLSGLAGWLALAWVVLVAMLLIPQRIIHENRNPLSRLLQRIYEPVFHVAMARPSIVLSLALLALVSTLVPLSRLGSEFMPPLNEGDLLYMPTTDPSIGISKSKELLQQTDKLIKTFPEVLSVHGKIGRAETSTDPAPLSMIETVAQLNPDEREWRVRKLSHFFSSWPRIFQLPFLMTFWRESRPINMEELKFGWNDPDGTFNPGLNAVVSIPGVANAWPYPIENRLNMLATGIKTPVGIKILGTDFQTLEDLATKAAGIAQSVTGTISAYPESLLGGRYIDIDIDRKQAARYGLTTGDVQDVIQSAIGGMNITTTVEGPERYPVNLRYARDFRDDLPALKELLIVPPKMAENGKRLEIPLEQLASVGVNPGPPMIRSENAQRAAWVFVDVSGRDLGSYVHDIREKLGGTLKLPPGYSIQITGQFEFWEKTVPRLIGAGILTLVLIILLLYLSSRSWLRVGIVMLAVPFSLIGAVWFMYLIGYNMSLAAVIGMIALAGLDAETGMVMLLYLDNSYERFKTEGRLESKDDLFAAIHDGAVKRIRPKAMTVSAAFIGLLPLLWAHGTGADTMRRIAAPMIGGLFISFLMELLIYPVVYSLFRGRQVGAAGGLL